MEKDNQMKRKIKIMNKPKIVRLTFALASLFAVTLASGQSMQSTVDAPQASPQLRYTVIDLGPRVANAIGDYGRHKSRPLGTFTYYSDNRDPNIVIIPRVHKRLPFFSK